MTEKQKEILKSMPKRDRGLYGPSVDQEEEDQTVPQLVDIEADPIEAAIKKGKIK